MCIALFRLLVDFGLLVLIWMIQLIVYPSFLYYSSENLVIWHKKYTLLIAYIVVPLMLLQLGFAIYQITAEISAYTVTGLVMVVLVWIITFLQFVPLHGKISKGITDKTMLLSLVKKNWTRTILWTSLFLMSLATFFIN
ncbi:MAG: hypothetical protein WBN11_16135 [Eudoraea sp.]|uniref:hypothetical protein n=1 Tax=Eudoraea sp. TaxID=1979955 RepID=UPI003C706F03